MESRRGVDQKNKFRLETEQSWDAFAPTLERDYRAGKTTGKLGRSSILFILLMPILNIKKFRLSDVIFLIILRMKARKKSEKLASQLENRKRNLAVIEETIHADPSSQQKLDSVKVFLSRRIETMELELTKS